MHSYADLPRSKFHCIHGGLLPGKCAQWLASAVNAALEVLNYRKAGEPPLKEMYPNCLLQANQI